MFFIVKVLQNGQKLGSLTAQKGLFLSPSLTWSIKEWKKSGLLREPFWLALQHRQVGLNAALCHRLMGKTYVFLNFRIDKQWKDNSILLESIDVMFQVPFFIFYVHSLS